MKPGMTPRIVASFLTVAALGLAPTACETALASATEMRMAVDEAVATGQANSLEDGILEITTDFTIGEGLANAAQRIHDLVASQIPCSTITAPSPDVLVIDFGALDDQCEYRGRTFAGVVTLTVTPGTDSVVVEHDYAGITDGTVTLDGHATVTWTEGQRHIVTEFDFDGRRGKFHATSDRTQTRIGAPGEGVRLSGVRDWSGPHGDWHLDIDDVEIRAIDPVPQDGAYVLDTPKGREITLSFERIDADTIEVTVTGGRRDRVFRVTSAGDVDDV